MAPSILRNLFALLLTLIIAGMIYMMFQRPALYPLWTIIMMGLVGLITFWYTIREFVTTE